MHSFRPKLLVEILFIKFVKLQLSMRRKRRI